jgi:uncharacterized membrane protein
LMRQPSQSTNLLIWQGSIIIISLVTALIPQYSWLFFIIYFIVILAFMMKSGRRMMKIPPASQLGSLIFREKQAVKTAMADKQLTEELKAQAKVMSLMLGLTFLVLILFWLYEAVAFKPMHNLLQSYFNNPILVSFLDFLIMYEIVTGILALPRYSLMGKMSSANLMLPQKYTVYRKGIVANDRFYVEFTPYMCYVYDTKRHFVEIRSTNKKQPFRIRLYTDSISTLVEKIRSIEALKPCEGEEGG